MSPTHLNTSKTWEFWIDRGGTFTDVIARKPDGSLTTLKLLSQNDAYDDAATEGAKRILNRAREGDNALMVEDAASMVKMGTTVATNALLELQGARTFFIVSAGFGDVLTIGDQTRPDIFALDIHRPIPLPERTLEVAGRLDPKGVEIEPLDEETARRGLQAAFADGYQAVAIAFINSYANNAHEARLAQLAQEAGFSHITCSHEASPLIKFVPRASTAVIDAYLQPVLDTYVSRVANGLGATPLYFMQSGGGLSDVNHFKARNAILSGPAGGVVGMAQTAKAAGYTKVIGFDMGGTSTDVSRFDGESYARTDSAAFAGRVLRAPMLDVHTVAAGGGSILAFDGERARVGPSSAGADPGPACYGRGGPATVTDANLVLGRIQPDWFPQVFGPNQDQPLNGDAARDALSRLAEAMSLPHAQAVAEGFLQVAVEAMADAIRQISTREGIDPRGYALNAFGGAGGQHACKVADALGMSTALIHPHAGLLSAYGIGLSAVRETREAGVERPFETASMAQIEPTLNTLAVEAEDSIRAQGGVDITVRKELRLRVEGSDTSIPVPLDGFDAILAAFGAAHAQLFGFAPQGQLIVESMAVEAEGLPQGAQIAAVEIAPQDGPVQTEGQVRLFNDGDWCDAPVLELASLGAGAVVAGPALIMDTNQTIIVDAGWRAERLTDGMLVLKRGENASRQKTSLTADPITLELYNRRFMSVAEDMGVVLERTAHSVNIKERLDFSCAVFDGEGSLVANAPHMPVHLGSMSASVQAALKAHPDLGPDDAIALNAPYNGGTHLPDITVIRPVHSAQGERLFFVAARGHHADIGGIAPGSMPPFSQTIDEEGVVLDAVKIVKHGQFDDDTVRAVLASGAHPARSPDRNIADLKAQLAACARGAQALSDLIKAEGEDVVRAYMGHVQDNAEAAVRRVIGALRDGHAVMALDGGARIEVSIKVDRERGEACVDFTGTSARLDSNFNAPSAVARAAVLYVLRCLVDDPIPLNEGCLKPITLIIPGDTLLSPKHPAAVVAGNVETSQLVVDALFAATGRMACGQGTMNNFTFGDDTRQYYETQCGGAGAGQRLDGTGFEGASAVHTHMTNSRLTDPEVLELRFPVRVRAHRIRTGSGGRGLVDGGNGAVRDIEFLEPLSVALLSGRRTVLPAGLNGGEPGLPGLQRLIKANGQVVSLPAKFAVSVEAGDRIQIETPGGGGFGHPTP